VDAVGNIYVAAGFSHYVWELVPSAGPPVPSVAAGSVLNGASFVALVAPGSIAAVFGSFALNVPDSSSAGPVPTLRSGLTIQFPSAGVSAPLFYASAGQVNLQIPWVLAGQSSATVKAVLNGLAGAAQTFAISPFAPGIFTMYGNGQGAVIDSSGNLVDVTHPASAGSVIQIYCTGLGPVTNPPATATKRRSESFPGSGRDV
jgi:uncharacterized protein (TIGR03437 family)